LFDFGPPDALYLGIRAGRRAVAVKSDDALAYQYLAQNYMTLSQQTREGALARPLGYPLMLRRVQITAALRHALDCDPDLESAHALASQIYLETGFLDLAKDHAEKRQTLLLQSPDAPTRRQAESMGKEIRELAKEVGERQTTYELHAAGLPPLGKVKAAQELGLGQKALDILEKVDWHSFAKDDPNKLLGVQRELSLLLQTGRAEEVGKTLKEDEQNLKDGLGVDPETGLPAYEWLRVQVAAAEGDYADADRWLQAIQEKTRQSPQLALALQQLLLLGPETADAADLEPSALTALLAGRLVLREAPSVGGPWLLWPPPFFDARFLLLQASNAIAEPLDRQADLDAVRGWLALEAGNTNDARDHFNDALRHASPGELPYRGRPLTQLDLEWLDRAK
jgi:Tfp pilus assembly protein PilF